MNERRLGPLGSRERAGNVMTIVDDNFCTGWPARMESYPVMHHIYVVIVKACSKTINESFK